MKTPLALSAGVALGIAIGFAVGSGGGKLRDGDQVAAGKLAARQPSGRTGPRQGSGADEVLADFLKGRSPAELTAEQAYQIIGPQLESNMMDWSRDPVERARMRYQFELLASKLPLDVLEQVMDLGRDKRANSHMLAQLLGSFAGRDLERAMEWAGRQPDSDEWRANLISHLAHTDPDQAVKLHREEMLAGSRSRILEGLPTWIAREYGKRGSAALFAIVDSMPGQDTNNLIIRGWETMPEGEKPAFLAEIRKRAAAGQTEYRYYEDTLRLARAESHPEELREWMEKMPPRSQANTALRLAAQQIDRGKTDAAKEYLKTAMNAVPGAQKDLVNSAAGDMYFNNPALFTMLVEMLPDDQKPTLKDASQWGNFGARPQAALDVAAYIASPEDRATYVARAFDGLEHGGLRKANAADFEILSRRLDALGLTGEAGEKARAALEGAREKTLGSK